MKGFANARAKKPRQRQAFNYDKAVSRTNNGSNLLWSENKKHNTSYYERIANAYHQNSSVNNSLRKAQRRGSQAAKARTWQNVLQNGLQLPLQNKTSRLRGTFSQSPSSYSQGGISSEQSVLTNRGISSSASDYKYRNFSPSQQNKPDGEKLVRPKGNAIYSPPSRQQVAKYIEQQNRYRQGQRISPNSYASSTQRQKQPQRKQFKSKRSRSPAPDTPEQSEKMVLLEIKELAAGVKFTPARAVGLGDMVVELSSRWRTSTTLALKTIAQLEVELTARLGEKRQLTKKLLRINSEHVAAKEKLELAHNFLKDKGLTDDFQEYLRIYSSPPKGDKDKGTGRNYNANKNNSTTDFDVEGKVEALSAAVRDGDSKLVSKFFDNLEAENGDDKLNLDGSADKKQAKVIANNHDLREVLDDVGEENENLVETKEEIEKLYAGMKFLSMEYIPKSIKIDREEIIELALRHGKVDDELEDKIRTMPFNSSEHIPDSVHKDRENGLKLLLKYSSILEDAAQETSKNDVSTLPAPPIKILVEVQSRKFSTESFIPIAVQQDRRRFLSFLFENGDTTYERVKNALALPYNSGDAIPPEIRSDRIDAIGLLFGNADFERHGITFPLHKVNPGEDKNENGMGEHQSNGEQVKDIGEKREEDEVKDAELILNAPSVEMAASVNSHPFQGKTMVPPEIKQDRQILLSKIYEEKKHTFKSLVSIVTDPFNGEVDIPAIVSKDRIGCINLLFGQDAAHLIQVKSQPFGGMAKPPAVVLRDRQKTVQLVLENEEFDDDDYNRILVMPFDEKKNVPESIIQDRMNTIHILMKRYDLTPEEIREEELGHARKVAQKKIELLPFSGLVDTVPASVLKDREESLDIIFNAAEYPEQQIRHLVLTSSYAGSTFIPEAILTDRHARLALLLPEPQMEVQHHQVNNNAVHLRQYQPSRQMDPKVQHAQHVSHVAPVLQQQPSSVNLESRLSSPPPSQETHKQPQSHHFPDKQASPQPLQPKEVHQEQLALDSLPETKIKPDEYAKAVPQKIAESVVPPTVVDFEPATVEEVEKMSKLLSAPYIGSPIVPDTVVRDRQESINILMGDGQLELDALVEIVLKKPYNGSERIPQSILEDRNQQLAILLEDDSDNNGHSEESRVQKNVASSSPSSSPQAHASNNILKPKQESITKERTSESDGAPTSSSPPPAPPAPPSNAHEVLAAKQALVSEEGVVGPKKVEGQKDLKHSDPFASDGMKNMKKVLYQGKPLGMTPTSIMEDRQAVISAVMNFKATGSNDIAVVVKSLMYANSTHVPEDILKFRKDLLEAYYGRPFPNILSKPPPAVNLTPKDEKQKTLLKLQDDIFSMTYADDVEVPETILADRRLIFGKIKDVIDLDKLVSGTVIDEKVNEVAHMILNDVDFQQIPAVDAPDDVKNDRVNVLKLVFPHASINITESHESAIDGSVPDNAIEERVAKAERLLALKEQAFKDLERSTMEGLL